MGFLKTLGSALTAGATDLIGSGISAGFNALAASKNRKFNREERIAAQQYNTAERIASQEYNTHMWDLNNKYNEDMYNKYQSPDALRRQYQAAGLNPLLAIDGGSVGSVGSASSTASPSSPQSISPAYNNGSAIPPIDNPFGTNSFVNMAAALKSLGDAKKTGVETDQLEAFFNENMRSLKLKNDSQELANLMDKVRLYYLPQKELAEVQKILTDISNGILVGKELKQKINILIKDGLIRGYEADHWLEQYQANLANTNAATGASKASATASYAAANASNASARLTNAQADIQELTNKIRNFKGKPGSPEFKQLSEYAKTEIMSMLYQIKKAGYDVKIAKSQSDKAGYDVKISENEAVIKAREAGMNTSSVTGQVGGVLQGLEYFVQEFMRASDFVFGDLVRTIVPEEYLF